VGCCNGCELTLGRRVLVLGGRGACEVPVSGCDPWLADCIPLQVDRSGWRTPALPATDGDASRQRQPAEVAMGCSLPLLDPRAERGAAGAPAPT